MTKTSALSILALSLTTGLFAAHDDAPIVEKVIQYKNWTLKDVKTGEAVELRSLIKDKKLVMLVYFSPWCGACEYELPLVAKLYEKYKDKGFEVIGVNEYSPLEEARKLFSPAGSPFRIVSESESQGEREKTLHYAYRKRAGDSRNFGVPWNIFLEPAKLARHGEVLTEKAMVINGEFVEADVDKFISDRLNPSDAANTPGKQ